MKVFGTAIVIALIIVAVSLHVVNQALELRERTGDTSYSFIAENGGFKCINVYFKGKLNTDCVYSE